MNQQPSAAGPGDISRGADSAQGGPPRSDTLPASELLSRRSTDFGLGEPPQADQPDGLIGRDLGGAVLTRLIAQGGMGRVYEAVQRFPARTVAVKVMRSGRGSPPAVRRFVREAEVLARLRHPGIAQVYTAGTRDGDDDTPFFVMEFVAGAEPLVEACDRRGLDVQRRLEVFLEVCRAVAHGHAAGVVHRDLKPGNILVGGDGRAKVIDFGIARIAEGNEEDLTETGGFIGTRRYTSPEQCEAGKVDQRTDVHALGMILHELLTGSLPYDIDGRSLAETARIMREQPPARLRLADRSLARRADAVAATCLAKRPADRYASAAELAADVARLLAGEPLCARPPGLLEACGLWCRRHRTLAASAAAAAVSAVVVAVVLSRGAGRPGPRVDGRPGPTARFPNVSSLRTTPLQWLAITFDEPIRSLSAADFHLARDGTEVPLVGATVTGEREHWEIRSLEKLTAAGGRYVLELRGTATTPIDVAGRRLAAPARAVWRMPPYREVAFNLLGDDWRRHVVSLDGLRLQTEQSAGAATFFQPTVPGVEGSIVMRFPAPFPVQAATLTAFIAVWTTGDPFPYDPGAKAALDVSPDGTTWTTLDSRQANHGGFGGGPFDIGKLVSGSREIWVRARLTATRSWPKDGLIHAQFLRSEPAHPEARPFRLTITGLDPGAPPLPPGTPPADG